MARKLKIAVTGAAGQIGYSILPLIASGYAFGPDTLIELRMLEIPEALGALEGVVMELQDCAYPQLTNMVITDDPQVAFDGISWAILVGAKPRTKGMERGDLLLGNGPIFTAQGRALNRAAADVRIVVVGNPANTNALIAMHNASDVPNTRFGALTRLDQNRAQAQLALRAGVPITEVTHVTIWGNHSATQYPDSDHARIGGKPAPEVIGDAAWLQGDFIKIVQQRGAAVINARGKSSAMSAANAAIDHVKSFEARTPDGHWFSAAVPSDGSYGITKGLLFSFPVWSDGAGGYEIVQGLPLSDFARQKLVVTEAELISERDVVAQAGLLG